MYNAIFHIFYYLEVHALIGIFLIIGTTMFCKETILCCLSPKTNKGKGVCHIPLVLL